MNKRNELISYALEFTSYLLRYTSEIENVILFGSVARGDFDTESDIDLFIDTQNNNLKKKIPLIINEFYQTEGAKRWKLKGIENIFSCLVGSISSEEWQDLKRGMMSNALILYGKYKATAERTHHYTLFSFGVIKPESTRVGLHRKLFGFTTGKKKYPGLAGRYSLVKMGKGSVLVPIGHSKEIKDLFKKKKITARVYDVWSDYKFQ